MLDTLTIGQGGIQAQGSVAEVLIQNNMDPHVLRPFIGAGGKTYIMANENGKLVPRQVHNTNATLRKEEWIHLDQAIVRAAEPRLKFVADVRGAGLTYSIPNGMGTTVLQTERMTDAGEAEISMDGLREGANDRPHFDFINLPLPIIHADFSFSARQLSASRNGGSPLDVTMGERAGRKVAEKIEKLSLGTLDTYVYGGGTIYGLTNFTPRLGATITSPAASSWVPATTVSEILSMRQQSVDNYFYGPWMVYMGSGWNQYLDEDYKAESERTLRERIKAIDGIQDVRTLDYLTGINAYAIILIQMTSDVVRMVVGMEILTLQWPSQGGLQLNFKVMGIIVPQFRADINNRTGIVHGAPVP